MDKLKFFNVGTGDYKADGIIGLVQKGTDVLVRYGDGTPEVILKNTSVMRVTAAVDSVKGRRR